jgi:hypothetical protein
MFAREVPAIGVTEECRDGLTGCAEERPRITDGVHDRLALIMLLALACGVPFVSRWRSHERR